MRTVIRTAVVLATVLAIALAGGVAATQPANLHCPDGGTKIESGSAGNGVVLPAGTLFCVKAGPGNTGILVADGSTPLQVYVGKDVSYYVVYTEVTPSPQPTEPTSTSTPTATLQPTLTPTSTPLPSASASISTPSPSTAPTTGPSDHPGPTLTSTAPSPTLPPTDTATASTSRPNDAWVFLVIFASMILSWAITMAHLQAHRRRR